MEAEASMEAAVGSRYVAPTCRSGWNVSPGHCSFRAVRWGRSRSRQSELKDRQTTARVGARHSLTGRKAPSWSWNVLVKAIANTPLSFISVRLTRLSWPTCCWRAKTVSQQKSLYGMDLSIAQGMDMDGA